MTALSLAGGLAAWAQDLQLSDVPPEVRQAVGRHLLDGVGCVLGAVRLGAAAPALAVARSLPSPPEAPVLGTGEWLSAPAAALATGVLVHALDFDDTHAGGLVHATASVLPVLVAVGTQLDVDGPTALLAAAVGYETVCRLGAAAPHAFHTRGVHATAAVGVVAAALTAARLAGLSPPTTVDAVGIAASSAGGLLEFLHTGASTKQLHPGSAGLAGVLAARLAAAGASGPTTALEGEYGLYRALAGRAVDPATVLAGLGATWESTRITVKPYPACQLLHAAVDAALAVAPRLASPALVRRVVVELPPDAVPIVAEPASAKAAPRTPYEAKFSVAWSVAAALADGQVGLDSYHPRTLARQDLRALARLVEHHVAPFPGPAADAPGRVEVHTTAGEILVGTVARSRGGPGAALSDGELLAKAAASAGLRPADLEPLAAGLRRLDGTPSFDIVLRTCPTVHALPDAA